MIPLHDDIPTQRVPFINYALILACTLVFFSQAATPDGGEAMIWHYGMVPAYITHAAPPGTRPFDAEGSSRPDTVLTPELPPLPPWATLLTCMFLHGGFMHLLGNMVFLYIFGDNVEDHYGHLGYLLLYLASGLAAGLLHLASAPGSLVPTIGASGAIAGVMGSYFVLFPHSRVMTLIPLGIFTQIVAVPAPFFLAIWFLFQLLSASSQSADGAGVAFWAHVGGFVAGLGTTWVGVRSGWLPPANQHLAHRPSWQRQRLPWM